jgi:lipoprotein signal peptidase
VGVERVVGEGEHFFRGFFEFHFEAHHGFAFGALDDSKEGFDGCDGECDLVVSAVVVGAVVIVLTGGGSWIVW